jgi:CRP-like cAMP-binding protein
MKSNSIIYKENDPIKKIFIIKSGLVCQFKNVNKKDLSPQLLKNFEEVFNKLNFPINIPIKNLSDGTFLGFDSLMK